MSVADKTLSLSPHALKAELFGFDPMIGRRLCADAKAGLLPHLHAVVADRKGEIILESYGSGPDEKQGAAAWSGRLHRSNTPRPSLRHQEHRQPALRHCPGKKGLVPRLDTPILSFFPEYADLASDPERMKRTVEHALTMSLGMEWDETRPYTDAEKQRNRQRTRS
ncbi:hypothetical protein QW131_14785 [Roseibium salinum]|nr:hypothetical protein [Roseibium salinum]